MSYRDTKNKPYMNTSFSWREEAHDLCKKDIKRSHDEPPKDTYSSLDTYKDHGLAVKGKQGLQFLLLESRRVALLYKQYHCPTLQIHQKQQVDSKSPIEGSACRFKHDSLLVK